MRTTVLRTVSIAVLACVPTITSAQSLEERIDAIIARMTLEEKILQLHQQGPMNTENNLRLSIPGFQMADGPHGVRDGLATSFPVGIGMAATWDTDLAFRVGVAMGKEFRAKGKSQALGPCVDLDRDPRNGRSPETGGEDPYLCARITTAVVQGIQTQPVIATVKHFSANHRENGRTSNNILASRRTLEEHNGLPFRSAVQEGGAFSVMNAYNLINGEKCAESPTLLTEILKEHWGFPYYVVSDWGSIWSAERAIKAGCDIEMGSDLYRQYLLGLVNAGAVSVGTIDRAVRNVIRTKLLSGVIGYLPPGEPGDLMSADHRRLCEEAARRSFVLLKNEHQLLPLDASAVRSVAVIGPSAAICQIDGSGSAYVTPAVTVSPLLGLQRSLGEAKVSYIKGCDINSADTSAFPAARLLARNADAVIYIGGLDPSQEGEGFDRVGGSIELPGKQQDLINALGEENPNLVAVIYSGGITGLSRSIGAIRSLLYGFYPGQESGTALAEILVGITNPSGRLPVTFPRSDAQLPAWNDDFTDDHGGGYRWFDKTQQIPQFAFGSGLSYTQFVYSDLSIVPAVIAPGEAATVTCTVTNTGTRDGEEIAQLYLGDSATTHSIAAKQLKGFSRVRIPAGGSATVSFTVGSEELYYYDEFLSSFTVEPGRYSISVGHASDQLPLRGMLEVSNTTARADLVLGSIRTVPAYPQPGQEVLFVATVRNVGAAATAPSLPLRVEFSVDGSVVGWSTTTIGSIPPGGMAQVCATDGPLGASTWTANVEGSHTIQARVDADSLVTESNERNNSGGRSFRVYPPARLNLAVGKHASATSTEGTGYGPELAVDGDMGSRWSSSFLDPQAIIVDLGSVQAVEDVTLYWEYAFAKEYIIRVSDGVGAWSDVWHETSGDGGMDRIPIGTSARKIMMLGLQRGTAFGYSLYEFEVHGSAVSGIATGGPKVPDRVVLADAFPNPFNPATQIRFSLPDDRMCSLTIYDLLGRRIASLLEGPRNAGEHSVTWNAADTPAGIYFCRLQAGDAQVTRKLVLTK